MTEKDKEIQHLRRVVEDQRKKESIILTQIHLFTVHFPFPASYFHKISFPAYSDFLWQKGRRREKENNLAFSY